MRGRPGIRLRPEVTVQNAPNWASLAQSHWWRLTAAGIVKAEFASLMPKPLSRDPLDTESRSCILRLRGVDPVEHSWGITSQDKLNVASSHGSRIKVISWPLKKRSHPEDIRSVDFGRLKVGIDVGRECAPAVHK